MPFLSSAQRVFMESEHPDIARRWSIEKSSRAGQRQNVKASPSSESHETYRPGVKRLPRLPGVKRDFGMLKPSAVARHAYAKPASETDSMSEGQGVRAHVPARPGKMSLTGGYSGLLRRDSELAGRRGK